jgi:hypothetical protein
MEGLYTNDNNTKCKIFEVEYWEMTPEYCESYDFDEEARDKRNDNKRSGKKDRDAVKWQQREVYFQSDLDETASDVEKEKEFHMKQMLFYLQDMLARREKRAFIKGANKRKTREIAFKLC